MHMYMYIRWSVIICCTTGRWLTETSRLKCTLEQVPSTTNYMYMYICPWKSVIILQICQATTAMYQFSTFNFHYKMLQSTSHHSPRYMLLVRVGCTCAIHGFLWECTGVCTCAYVHTHTHSLSHAHTHTHTHTHTHMHSTPSLKLLLYDLLWPKAEQ